MPSTREGEVAWPLRVDRVRDVALVLGPVYGVVGGAVENDLGGVPRNGSFNGVRVGDRDNSARDGAGRSKQPDEL